MWYFFSTVIKYMFAGPYTEAVNARSHTSLDVKGIDWTMAAPSARCFILCTLLPPLYGPLLATHIFGAYRCARTFQYYVETREEKIHRMMTSTTLSVLKRTYDRKLRKLVEVIVMREEEHSRALRVVNGKRGVFVDDPTEPNVAYFVHEQEVIPATKVINPQGMGMSIVADIVRYLVPIGVLLCFAPASRRMTVDIRMWLEGRLLWTRIRHPISNFFLSGEKYREEVNRVILQQKMENPRGYWARLWIFFFLYIFQSIHGSFSPNNRLGVACHMQRRLYISIKSFCLLSKSYFLHETSAEWIRSHPR